MEKPSAVQARTNGDIREKETTPAALREAQGIVSGKIQTKTCSSAKELFDEPDSEKGDTEA